MPHLRGKFSVNARGWVYAVLTLSVGVAAAVKGNNLLFAVFSVLLGVMGASALLTVLVARRMEVSRLLPEAIRAGEHFGVALRFRNGKRLLPAFCLRFEDRLTHEGRPASLQPTPVWLPLARPGERVRGTSWVAAHQRGWARLGPLAVTSEFTPGLFSYRTHIPVEDQVLVTPRMGVLNRRLINPYLAQADYADVAASMFTPGEEEFASLREYRPGDNLRRIHWKMSARMQNKLLVREFENARIRNAAVLLDTCVPNPGDARRRMRLERAVSFAATLAEELLAENYQVRFRAFGPDLMELHLPPRRGSMEELLGALALLKASRIHPLSDLIAEESGAGDEIYFLLKIGDEPLPAWEPLRRAVVMGPAEMRALMHLPS